MYFSTSVMNVFFRYPSDCLMYLYVFIAMMYFMHKSSIKRRILYLLLTLFSILFIFNPICFKIVDFFRLSETYYRFFWAVPITFTIAAFIVKMVQDCSNKYAKLAIIFIIAVCIIMGKTSDYVGAHLSDKDNLYGFKDDIIDISNIIEADTEKTEPKVLTDEYVFTRLRCYNANIIYRVPRKYYLNDRIGENGYYTEDGTGNPALVRMEQLGEKADEETMRAILEELNVDYIIIKSEFDMGEYLNKFNYVLLGTTDIYEVYKVGTEG